MPLHDLSSALKSLTQANRPIRLRISTDQGVADDLLMVKHVSGVETVCGGIEYRLLCVSTKAGLPLKQFSAGGWKTGEQSSMWKVCVWLTTTNKGDCI